MASPVTGNFPVGATLAGGAYLVAERLAGERARGLYSGISRWDFDQRHVLVTVTTAQVMPLEDIAAGLAIEIDGVARLRHVGPVEGASPGATYHGMVEEMPAGEPVARTQVPLAPAAVVTLVTALARLAARIRAEAPELDWLQPELIYVRWSRKDPGTIELSGVAPRAPLFALGARPPDYAVGPLFRDTYRAPETAKGRPSGPSSDVFALCAMAAHWLSGEHPFQGDFAARQTLSIALGRRRPWTGGASWGALLAAGLERDPVRRPRLDELPARFDQALRAAPSS